MCECNLDAGISFFNSIAPSWDSWHDLESLYTQLSTGLEKFGLTPGEYILDVGCGTGNLTKTIIDYLSDEGRVTAVDISPAMIETARAKFSDRRITWLCNAVEEISFEKDTFDRIICYSVWPHLSDIQHAILAFRLWLKPGGKLHIWHTISREAVNKIHSELPAVKNHHLDPADQTASLLASSGFTIEEQIDDTNTYLVTARKE
jgi:demethylmenaquinone methyltransferase/2-methoxy-6-polyprenyl-1,4-benzoquinol methylase